MIYQLHVGFDVPSNCVIPFVEVCVGRKISGEAALKEALGLWLLHQGKTEFAENLPEPIAVFPVEVVRAMLAQNDVVRAKTAKRLLAKCKAKRKVVRRKR
jgi:hypothetical protein